MLGWKIDLARSLSELDAARVEAEELRKAGKEEEEKMGLDTERHGRVQIKFESLK